MYMNMYIIKGKIININARVFVTYNNIYKKLNQKGSLTLLR